MEQYRNCNRNGGRYPAQPNLMMQYANNRNASSCNGNRQGTGGCRFQTGSLRNNKKGCRDLWQIQSASDWYGVCAKSGIWGTL